MKPLYYISNLLAQSIGFYQRCVPSAQDALHLFSSCLP
ncbi:unnamed protein product [Larinioides sclopetarius]|uniref:Uncharacterized protein n=1 Tax=Larinioides sclopetarius TaxID=280406 RepID=A0AAV1ZVA2_9ARAC